MSDYGITFAPTLDRPPETMVGETVFDSEGNVIGWIVNATVGAGTCQGEIDTDYFECKLTWFECKGCGWRGVVDNICVGYSFDGTDMPRHCPNCGRKLVDE